MTAVLHLPFADLIDGVAATLNVAAVTSLATGGVHNQLPADPTYPAVAVTAYGRPDRETGPEVWQCRLEVGVFSAYFGDSQALAIADAILGLLEGQSITVPGWLVEELALAEVPRPEPVLLRGQQVIVWLLVFDVQMEVSA